MAQARTLWSKSTEWGQVVVRQDGGQRALVFISDSGETEESRMSVEDPTRPLLRYVQQMLAMVAVWESTHPSMPESPRFLVVGLGGASLSNALASVYPKAEVVSVEIEPVVVEAAQKFFFYRESALVQTVVDDARHYLLENKEPFDVIFLDAFDGVGVPPTLRTVEFVELLDRNLHPQGAVVANIHFTPREPSLRYQKSLTEVFEHSYITVGLAQGIGLLSHAPHSSYNLLHQDLSGQEKRFRLPLKDLLHGRHQESLEGVEPYRDSRD